MTRDGERLPPFSLHTLLTPVFTVSSTVSRAVRTVSATSPSSVYAAATDGSFKILDCSVSPPVESRSLGPASLAPSKKSIDKLAVLETVDRLLVLAEGVLTFHNASTLDVMSSGAAARGIGHSAVKNVLSFAVDDFNARPDHVEIAIIRRKGVAHFKVSRNNVELLHEVSVLNSLITTACLRNGFLCYSDATQYSIIDLNAGEQMDLITISNEEPKIREDGTQEPTNPDQKPAVGALGNSEFLLANHTGSTSLGMFFKADTGEPVRGTIAWASNVRSIAIDHEYVIALLHNRTIEFHHIANQSLIHLIHLPEPLSDPRSLLSVYPRSFIVPSAPSPVFSSCNLIEFPLHVQQKAVEEGENRPSTPPPHTLPEEKVLQPGSIPIECRVLLISRNSVTSLQPLSLLERIEHYIRTGKLRRAISITANLSTASYENQSFIAYVNLKVGLSYLFETQFQEAGACFAVACAHGCDPRLLIYLWPEYRLEEWQSDHLTLYTWAGVQSLLDRASRGIQGIVMANLYKNYSPGIKPEIESQTLNTSLLREADVMLHTLLVGWQESPERTDKENRYVRRAVDTVLAKMAALANANEDVLDLIGRNTVAMRDMIDFLEAEGKTSLLAKVYAKVGRHEDLLALWIRVYKQDDESVTLGQIAALISSLPPSTLRREQTMWLLQHDESAAVEIFNTTLDTSTLTEFEELHTQVDAVNADAALRLLQYFTFKHDHESKLTSEKLFDQLIERLRPLLKDASYREASKTSRMPDDRTALPERLLQTLDDPALGAISSLRLRLILLLYVEQLLEPAKVRSVLEGMPDLVFERAMIYGRVGLYRQALATLVINGQDVHSAEVACLQHGCPISNATARSLANRLNLPTDRVRPAEDKEETPSNGPAESDLMRLLIEVLLGNNTSSGNSSTLLRFVNAQAAHLDVIETLDRLPESSPVADIQPFLTRGLRRVAHNQYETQIIKALATSQFQAAEEALWDRQQEMGGILAEEDDSSPKLQMDEKDEKAVVGDKIVEKLVRSQDELGDDVIELR